MKLASLLGLLEVTIMISRSASTSLVIALGSLAIAVLLPVEAQAYVDPGTTGMLSQVLYVLFYGALGVFFYLLRNIKEYLANAKQFLAKFFGGWG